MQDDLMNASELPGNANLKNKTAERQLPNDFIILTSDESEFNDRKALREVHCPLLIVFNKLMMTSCRSIGLICSEH